MVCFKWSDDQCVQTFLQDIDIGFCQNWLPPLLEPGLVLTSKRVMVDLSRGSRVAISDGSMSLLYHPRTKRTSSGDSLVNVRLGVARFPFPWRTPVAVTLYLVLTAFGMAPVAAADRN